MPRIKIAISIEHPAWAHQFRSIIEKNSEKGDTLVLAVDKDGDLKLLDAFEIDYIKLADSTGKNLFEKGFLFIKLCILYTKHIRKFNPDVLIGRASPMMAVAAYLTKKPHVIYEDTEVSKFSLCLCRMFSYCIITPQTFFVDLGHKQIRQPIYKELFYLHRDFKPEQDVVKSAGIDINRPYAIVRFVSWNASHDLGVSGLDDKNKVSFIQRLSEIIQVYISSEGPLLAELEKYRLDVPYDKIHHFLYYATLVFSEGASMASEAAVLGTHTFYINKLVSGTTEEQQNRFELLRALHDPQKDYDRAIDEANKLLNDKDIWRIGKTKREKLLDAMPNPNDFFWDVMKEAIKNEVEE